jgi:glutathione S-transferase
MKLYSMHNSNNCRRLNATLQHLGIDAEIVEMDMASPKKPELLAINPNGKVPTLVDGHLESRKWMLGDEITLADFSVGACFSYAEASGLPWDDYKHIKAWWSRLCEIPAWKNTSPKLG